MKILFVSCYVNNPHFMKLTKKSLDKYLINTKYDYICLNDAPDIKNGEENYLKICDILTNENDCYEKILFEANKQGFIHIKVPQHLHIKNRPNHSSLRHTENLNWFNSNIESLYPTYKEYNYICHIDCDCILKEPIDLNIELNGYDMAGPFIYINQNKYYIHTGLFFINVKTVKNMNEINWDNTLGTDTGSNIHYFIKNNPEYKIKKLGHYDGYSNNNWIPNEHTIFKLKIDDIIDEDYKLIDSWFDKKFVHFRAGSCFGVGSNVHRNNDRLYKYNKKIEAFLKLINIM
jgi:hypothetical protein